MKVRRHRDRISIIITAREAKMLQRIFADYFSMVRGVNTLIGCRKFSQRLKNRLIGHVSRMEEEMEIK